MKDKISFLLFFGIFFFATTVSAQNSTSIDERVYIKIEIKGLACPYCAYGMEKELLKVAGVDKVDIELKEGLAYISTPVAQKPTKENLSQIITEAGFTAGAIEFQETPFPENKSKKKKRK